MGKGSYLSAEARQGMQEARFGVPAYNNHRSGTAIQQWEQERTRPIVSSKPPIRVPRAQGGPLDTERYAEASGRVITCSVLPNRFVRSKVRTDKFATR